MNHQSPNGSQRKRNFRDIDGPGTLLLLSPARPSIRTAFMHRVEAVFVCAIIADLNPFVSAASNSNDCSPFCPPQTLRPVDKSQDSRCPTQGSMRPFSCQAGKPESEAERKRKAERNERTVRYLARAFQKRKWKKQESRGCCRTTNVMCGPRPHRQKPTPGRIPKAVRQTGDPSGPPASRTPEIGKNGP